MYFKISFCTTCMNRLRYLKKTLPSNIRQNRSYPFVEFVLLDYNSQDGLEDWAKEQMSEEIKSGVLVYLKTFDPVFFHMSHAKNMASKYSGGDIICNIDADNFVGENFAFYLNNEFNSCNNIYLSGGLPYGSADTTGKIILKKSDFFNARGYDERICGYGFEDDDLKSRLNKIPLKRIALKRPEFLRFIPNDMYEKLENMCNSKGLRSILLDKSDKKTMYLLLLREDYTFEKCTLIPNKYIEKKWIPWCIQNGSLEEGIWKAHMMKISLYKNSNKFMVLNTIDGGNTFNATHSSRKYLFCNILNKEKFTKTLYWYNLITNQEKYQENKNIPFSSINKKGFGAGLVYKNFNYDEPLINGD